MRKNDSFSRAQSYQKDACRGSPPPGIQSRVLFVQLQHKQVFLCDLQVLLLYDDSSQVNEQYFHVGPFLGCQAQSQISCFQEIASDEASLQRSLSRHLVLPVQNDL